MDARKKTESTDEDSFISSPRLVSFFLHSLFLRSEPPSFFLPFCIPACSLNTFLRLLSLSFFVGCFSSITITPTITTTTTTTTLEVAPPGSAAEFKSCRRFFCLFWILWFFGSLSWIGNFYGSLVLKQFFYRFFSAREEIFQPSQSSSFLVPKDQSNLVIFLFFSNTSPIHSSFLPPFHHLFSFLQAFAVICLALFQVRSPFLVHHITYSVFHLFCVRKLFVFH